MRVTQSMLASGTLNHLSNNYQKMQGLQDQLSTGKKITRASDDPVVAMNGMRYRSQVGEMEQFERNTSEVHNWMDTADDTLGQTTDAMTRIRELTVQAANDSYDADERANIAAEVGQLREHIESMANTQNNGKYVFNGTDTTNAPVDPEQMNTDLAALEEMDDEELAEQRLVHNGESYAFDAEESAGDTYVFTNGGGESIEVALDGAGDVETITAPDGEEVLAREVTLMNENATSTNEQDVEIELLKGVNVPVNIDPDNVYSEELFAELHQLEDALRDPEASGEELTGRLDGLDGQINNIVDERAELGARMNRVEMIEDRIADQSITAERIMSDNEDAQMEEVITELLEQENVHRAALSASGRIIQPTLMDFLG
ncbi:flagellar hook-associated protein FlgL [Salisediminibacterium halotolerans]|uniref:Flagellar hook-associated protein 3 FlgL n=1 Tax=Salisediminibacterium halotolerans TaxID=517425 RepID=A0A1H9TSU7_9BACI|nr:flagellar hook-associated protein FlgL [Salisediminibacterium haloalkalitolerans]SES00061.1 flagellar hook-associated protein 3 FlgL [Salisediminibacterium haloalkalitolerans]